MGGEIRVLFATNHDSNERGPASYEAGPHAHCTFGSIETISRTLLLVLSADPF